jgi:hypothetical protein
LKVPIEMLMGDLVRKSSLSKPASYNLQGLDLLLLGITVIKTLKVATVLNYLCKIP